MGWAFAGCAFVGWAFVGRGLGDGESGRPWASLCAQGHCEHGHVGLRAESKVNPHV